MKITFVMGTPDEKKHSVKFNFLTLEETDDGKTKTGDLVPHPEEIAKAAKALAFYVPKPIAEHSKRIRVTLEEIA
jgi:hypothetical protein